MTNLPDPCAPAEAARRHAIALVRARLDEIVERTGSLEAAQGTAPATSMPGACSRGASDLAGHDS
jgi:hypothetical protein